MDIIKRLFKLIIFLYITGKWLVVLGGLLVFTGLIIGDGLKVFLIDPGAQVIALVLIVSLTILSVVEWILFGKLTWRYDSFSKKDS